MIALADKITKSFGGRVLYTQATLQLNAGERWALVGPNGAGKTTLLKIIMGQESPDEGTVSFAKETTVGYLEQETKIDGEKTALQEVVDSAHEVKGWERRVAELEAKISTTQPGLELDRLLEDFGIRPEGDADVVLHWNFRLLIAHEGNHEVLRILRHLVQDKVTVQVRDGSDLGLAFHRHERSDDRFSVFSRDDRTADRPRLCRSRHQPKEEGADTEQIG